MSGSSRRPRTRLSYSVVLAACALLPAAGVRAQVSLSVRDTVRVETTGGAFVGRVVSLGSGRVEVWSGRYRPQMQLDTSAIRRLQVSVGPGPRLRGAVRGAAVGSFLPLAFVVMEQMSRTGQAASTLPNPLGRSVMLSLPAVGAAIGFCWPGRAWRDVPVPGPDLRR